MTKREFKAKAAAAFARVNPTAAIQWLDARFVTYPTGVQGWHGRFEAIADGYRTRVMLASGDDSHVMVR